MVLDDAVGSLRGALLGHSESSRETSGLPFVYLLKTLIPLFALLIGLQGVAQAIRAALVLAAPQPTAIAA